ncbi:MAG: hypothetical protein ACMV0F_04360 [Trichlorobacter sp.]
MFNLIKAAKKVPQKAPVPLPNADVLAFFKVLAEAYKENQQTEREIARIEAAKEILITNIKEKYGFYREVFDQIFTERKAIMNKHFDIIDHGISTNNRDLVLCGLQGLGQLVSTSPFSDISNLSKMLENDIPIEL